MLCVKSGYTNYKSGLLPDSTMTTTQQPNTDEWIELKDSKQFSRLLYTNPVCFLSTLTASEQQRNVMVLSWLTATNNEGRFLFSLNRRRHTSSLMSDGCEFVLSVPIKGMETLIKEVGSTSGRWGSKFIADHDGTRESAAKQERDSPMSKRQKKRQQATRSLGIEGLNAVPLGLRLDDDSGLFAVQGTIAHLHCRVYSMMQGPVIDDAHYLVFGEVVRAFVHSSYWDSAKCLFRPNDASRPYLTFFGSQTFGYIVTK